MKIRKPFVYLLAIVIGLMPLGTLAEEVAEQPAAVQEVQSEAAGDALIEAELPEEPAETEVPKKTEAPEETKAPKWTEVPEETAVAELTEETEAPVEAPEETEAPSETVQPTVTECSDEVPPDETGTPSEAPEAPEEETPARPQPAEETGFVLTGPAYVTTGKSITLTAWLNDAKITSSKVRWSVTGGGTISRGKYTAASRVTAMKEVTVTAEYGDNTATYVIAVLPAVTSVVIDTPAQTIDMDTVTEFALEAHCLPEDADQMLTYVSSNKRIATVSADGVVTPKKAGIVTVTVKSVNGKKKTVKLSFIHALTGLTITGAESVTAGKSIVLKAIAQPVNATNASVIWETDSADAAIRSGKLTVKKTAAAQIITVKARSTENSEIVAEHCVTVFPLTQNVVLSAPTDRINLNSDSRTIQLTAACLPAESDQKVTWKTSRFGVASVSKTGLVTGRSAGTAVITATSSNGKTARITIRVVKELPLESLTVTGRKTVTGGNTVTLTAHGAPDNAYSACTWAAESDLVSCSSDGVITTSRVDVRTQVAIRVVSCENRGIQDIFTLTLLPEATLALTADGEAADLSDPVPTLQLKTVFSPADAYQDVIWSSEDTSVATVDEDGLVTAKKVGSVVIRAKTEEGVSASYTVRVIRSATRIDISGGSEVKAGETISLSAKVYPEDATDKTVTWSLNCDSSVATFSEGTLTAGAVTTAATVTVTVTCGKTVSTKEILVYPKPTGVKVSGNTGYIYMHDGKGSIQLSASFLPSDSKSTMKWYSLYTDVATVSQTGLVTAKKAGVARIAAYDRFNTQCTEWIYIIVLSDGDTLTDKVNTVLAETISESMSDYEKALALHDYIVQNADYDYSLSNAWPDGVLLKGSGTCNSYATAYQLLLTLAGVESVYVTGQANGYHAWNKVLLGDDWYNIDCTWDDIGNGSYTYNYFGVSDQLIYINHIETGGEDYPEADGTAYNYYLSIADAVVESVEELKAAISTVTEASGTYHVYYANVESTIVSVFSEMSNAIKEVFTGVLSITASFRQLTIVFGG